MNPSSFEAIWGSELAPNGYVMVPKCLVRCQKELGIRSGELNTIVCLLSFHYGHRDPYPSKDTISQGTNKASGTVQRHIRSLEERGLVKRRFNGRTNTYSFEGLKDELIVHLETCSQVSKTERSAYLKTDTQISEIGYPEYPKMNSKEDSRKKQKKKTNKLDVASVPARNVTDRSGSSQPGAGYQAFQEARRKLLERTVNKV